MTISVLIADDSSLQRSGGRIVLESQPDVAIVHKDITSEAQLEIARAAAVAVDDRRG